jgi:HEAT repeat protein
MQPALCYPLAVRASLLPLASLLVLAAAGGGAAGAPPAGAATATVDEAARRAAIAAAATAPLDRAAGMLDAAATGDALVRAAAAEALGRHRHPDAVARLVRALASDPDARVRREAARGLAAQARRLDARLFARAGREYLPDDAHVVDRAPLAPDAVDGLARAVTDGDPDVRAAAIRTLGEVGPAAARGGAALLERLDRATDVHERAETARALGRVGDAAAAPRLARALRDDASPRVRAAAAAALGRLATTPEQAASLAGPLADALRDTDPATRAAAATSLAAVSRGDTSAVSRALVAALDDPAEGVRAAAADALAALRAPGPADLDRRIARESAPSTRAALHALAAASLPAAAGPHLDVLVAALADRAARRAAERGLVRLATAGVPVAERLRAAVAGPAPHGGAEGLAARALTRVQHGGPLVLPEAR